MTFYLQPPSGDISFHKLEEFGLNRLRFLTRLSACKDDNECNEALRDAETVNWSECLISGSIKDKISHFILRLTLSNDSDTAEFLCNTETTFFRLRLESFTSQEWLTFFKTLGKVLLQYENGEELTALRLLFNLLSKEYESWLFLVEGIKSKDETRYVHLPFQLVPHLVSRRCVTLKQGSAVVPLYLMPGVLEEFFKQFMSDAVHQTSKQQRTFQTDSRMTRLSAVLRRAYLREMYPITDIPLRSKALTLDTMTSSQICFPLCMSQLMNVLRKHHRLRHHDRIQLTLFLKELGLPLHQALLFWKQEYSKPSVTKSSIGCRHDWRGNERRYIYNIRHLYGLEGRRVSYTAHSCDSIQGRQLLCSDYGGCPFTSLEISSLSTNLTNEGLDESDIEDIIQCVRDGCVEKACRLSTYHKMKLETSNVLCTKRRHSKRCTEIDGNNFCNFCLPCKKLKTSKLVHDDDKDQDDNFILPAGNKRKFKQSIRAVGADAKCQCYGDISVPKVSCPKNENNIALDKTCCKWDNVEKEIGTNFLHCRDVPDYKDPKTERECFGTNRTASGLIWDNGNKFGAKISRSVKKCLSISSRSEVKRDFSCFDDQSITIFDVDQKKCAENSSWSECSKISTDFVNHVNNITNDDDTNTRHKDCDNHAFHCGACRKRVVVCYESDPTSEHKQRNHQAKEDVVKTANIYLDNPNDKEDMIANVFKTRSSGNNPISCEINYYNNKDYSSPGAEKECQEKYSKQKQSLNSQSHRQCGCFNMTKTTNNSTLLCGERNDSYTNNSKLLCEGKIDSCTNNSTLLCGGRNDSCTNNSTLLCGGKNDSYTNNSVLLYGERNDSCTNNSTLLCGGRNDSTNNSTLLCGGNNDSCTKNGTLLCGGKNDSCSTSLCGGKNDSCTNNSTLLCGGRNDSTNNNTLLCGGNNDSCTKNGTLLCGGKNDSCSTSLCGGKNDSCTNNSTLLCGGKNDSCDYLQLRTENKQMLCYDKRKRDNHIDHCSCCDKASPPNTFHSRGCCMHGEMDNFSKEFVEGFYTNGEKFAKFSRSNQNGLTKPSSLYWDLKSFF